ncbi:MAG: vanadium-dependent haloperoxidase [Bdellovibrionales bacterium]|nr:vanadium-dependent haloperoxidase [Bdellovibrionales bacterium]
MMARYVIRLGLLLVACSVPTLVATGCGSSGGGQSEDAALFDPQKSAARNWNEALLAAIRVDFARPTVHARNLFHSSAMMYDLWAAYDAVAQPYFLGAERAGVACPFTEQERERLRATAIDVEADRSEAISYAMHRLLHHRFANSPGAGISLPRFDALLSAQGFDPTLATTDYSKGGAAALGRYLADCVIRYGLNDGANESAGYANQHYQPVNPPLNPALPGANGLVDPDRWQPLALAMSIDQAGNPTTNQPPFLSAEWGRVVPFALQETALSLFERDGVLYPVYLDPGAPALLRGAQALPEEYQWTHSLVALWSAHLDPADGVLWDVSPGSIGNTTALPQTIQEMRQFYDPLEGGVRDQGHTVNPFTGAPYEPQIVPRGDYTRVLAEFWADGPRSETPPGHWFTIANTAVHDHPAFERRYRGVGPVLSDLEWDVKLYFVLGGALHDAAITAWGIKGWYDYIRPISALRAMAELGQSSDPNLPRYDPEGIPLVTGRIEVVQSDDVLAGDSGEHVGKIKVLAWRGPEAVSDPQTQTAGVGWILLERWWPFQLATFVTPPFAGYVSGHSTFSRAAAEVLTALTGSEYFPGGMGEFVARKNEFLVFERGPSVDVRLQWATYRDASDQTSLSRIWGGIHPPVDDIPGRRLGIKVAESAVALAEAYFSGRGTAL